MDFNELIQRFISAGTYLRERAVVAVNRAATVRNWCFGIFIVEYEQNGEDRAQYGERLIERLSSSLTERGMKGVSVTALKLCRQFYLAYPEIGQTLTDQFEIMGGHDVPTPTVLRRFDRGLYNLFHSYVSLLDSWMLFNNSGKEPVVIAKETNGERTIFNEKIFSQIRRNTVV
jgi:hypothetical protein